MSSYPALVHKLRLSLALCQLLQVCKTLFHLESQLSQTLYLQTLLRTPMQFSLLPLRLLLQFRLLPELRHYLRLIQASIETLINYLKTV